MKITDQELLQAIWINQLRILSKNVFHHYIGGGIALCADDDYWFKSASSEGRVSRHNVTDKICRGQLLIRLRRLKEEGLIKTYHQDLATFMIDGRQARKAFDDTRAFWMGKGVPFGYENGRAKLTKDVDIKKHLPECQKMLLDKYPSFEK